MQQHFTLGIEEEFQIIDPKTRELTSAISQMIESTKRLDTIKIQSELHQSVVEVASGICPDIKEARRQVIDNRREANRIASDVGLRIGAASTHPFSRWEDQEITPQARYTKIVGELQDVARGNLIFGMHVHVGIDDREEALAIFNSARYFLPHLLALTTSSPFFGGRNTGVQSARSLIFRRLPRTGIPEEFSSYRELEQFLELLVKVRSIDDGRRIWWDLRPHPIYSTLEFRICDIPSRVDDVVAVAALIQALVARLTKMHRNNQQWRSYRSPLLEENKWRAIRYGVHGKLVDFGRQTELPFRDLVYEMLDFVDEVVDHLGSRDEISHIETILDQGTSADRQLAVYEETGSLEAVVDLILEETMMGIE
jgi:carboxylate-amine ligase